MKSLQIAAIACFIAVSIAADVEGRLWTDSTGKYTLEAKLIMFNDKSVVLQREDHELVAIPVEKLSDKDREFLKSKDAADAEKTERWACRPGHFATEPKLWAGSWTMPPATSRCSAAAAAFT